MAVKNAAPKPSGKLVRDSSVFVSHKSKAPDTALATELAIFISRTSKAPDTALESELAKLQEELSKRFSPEKVSVTVLPPSVAPEDLTAGASVLRDLHAMLSGFQTMQMALLEQSEKLRSVSESVTQQLLSILASSDTPADEAQTSDEGHSGDESPAALALQGMRKRLKESRLSTKLPAEFADLSRTEASELLKTKWIESGRLRSSSELSKAWGRSRQALDQATARGELFSLKSASKRYYPAAFLELDAVTVARVCLALEPLSPASKFIFWDRPHGGLRGLTVPEYLMAPDGDRERVVLLALAYVRDQLPVGSPAQLGSHGRQRTRVSERARALDAKAP